MIEFELTPIFPTILCSFFLEEGTEIFYQEIINETSLVESDYGRGSQISVNNNVLDNWIILKDQIECGFLSFKDNVLNLRTTHFKMTTSWMTKTPPNCGSQKHMHKNSYYSGVLYLTEHFDQSPIMFFNPNESRNSILTNPAEEYNGLNAKTWTIHPEKNKVIFFPSYLEHLVRENLSSDDRYSIAFNFFPFGKIGENDSQIELIY